jgi:transcriptional regulator with XRE-family HTH domain
MNANQIRAARALLNWSRKELIDRSGLSLTTIRRMEDDGIGPARSSARNVALVAKTLEDAGIIFLSPGDSIDGAEGVRLTAHPRSDQGL